MEEKIEVIVPETSKEELRLQALEAKRKRFRQSLLSIQLPQAIIDGLQGATVKHDTNYHSHSNYPLNDTADKKRDEGPEIETDVVEIDPHEEEIRMEVAKLAERTPEVRFNKQRMTRDFTDDELKIIAAALRSRTAIYRVADSLHCSYIKIRRAIEEIPVLKELAEERTWREKEEAEEAVDDCIRSRVPAVVMWKAEKILPEKYGSQVNIDNEDDARLVIGAIPDDEVQEAEAFVANIADSVPKLETTAVMQSIEAERAAENAAAGGGIPVAPLSAVPPAPALNPPAGDPRFGQFVPASQLSRAPVANPVQEDIGPDNYGAIGGGFGDDDFDDGSWI